MMGTPFSIYLSIYHSEKCPDVVASCGLLSLTLIKMSFFYKEQERCAVDFSGELTSLGVRGAASSFPLSLRAQHRQLC